MPSITTPFRFSAAFLTTILLLTNFSARAQDDAVKKAGKVEFRVTRFDLEDRKSPVYRTGGEGKQVEIEVPLTFIAGPFEATLRDGRFLDLWQGASEKPEISVEITAAEREHLLLVFFQQDKSLRILKVLCPPSRIKGGDRFIINATPSEMAIKLGNADPLMIPASKSGVLAGPAGSVAVSLPVLVSLKEGDKWKLASTEQWPFDPRFRKYLVAYMSPRSRQLVFHSVSEKM